MIDSSSIIASENINDKILLIFKESSTYKLITANAIDPEEAQQDTAHTYEKIASFGASSIYVSRIFIQFKRIIDFISLDGLMKSIILEKIWSLNEQLLICAQSELNIREQLKDVMDKCQLIIEEHKSTGVIPALPKVKNLDNEVKTFLSVGKQFLIDCFKIIGDFTSLPINRNNEAHFDKHIDWLQKNTKYPNDLGSTLANDLPWIRQLAECRNAVEHPSEGQMINIENTRLLAGNKFSLPTWSYDLSKKLNIKQSGNSIHEELDIYLNNMFNMLEDILLFCLGEKIKENSNISIYTVSDDELDPKCPIKYYAGPSERLIEKLKIC
ncbi:hypothetical protein [Comamonas sp. 17RB]|uniref:hypothetical protein n=1 Tax=Comamonas sp. 17RB TaxID=3047025 RepID=UPI0024B6C754|nr:hypothetical protein [Comamonas sp. 17RB]MDI9855176.1 hypothetical protein [Comamonas sp. 17RB]